MAFAETGTGESAAEPPAGDAQLTFGELFDRVAPDLLRYLARRVGPDAEDLLADTFLLAFELRDSFDPRRGEARAWMFGLASNVLRRHLRTEQRHLAAVARHHRATQQYDQGHAEGVERSVDAGRELAALATDLADLNPADRDVLLLTAWGGLTATEVAQALEIPVGTVRSRLHRVRRRLRSATGSD